VTREREDDVVVFDRTSMSVPAYRRGLLALLAASCAMLEAQPAPDGQGAASAEDDGPWFIQHDCQLCHQIDQRTIGPAYRDIANRYASADEATIEMLATHVIEGSAGRWGDMPMTPHADLGKDEARAMVQRIILLVEKR
jgi:cytochrome c551/c552